MDGVMAGAVEAVEVVEGVNEMLSLLANDWTEGGRVMLAMSKREGAISRTRNGQRTLYVFLASFS